MRENRSCSPNCKSFKCSQRALIIRPRAYCRWAEDDCVGPSCNYAMCAIGRILSNGLCGLSIRRKTNEEIGPEDLEVNIKLKGKLQRRFREEDLI